ncbi:hypothetical protein Sgou_34250 [Streptomyces gougerotii]|uniref:Uncharacterized protein n=1 Tax=Streptomyces gougerotii TaxID=53448 RepID=A0ABQ1D882_9ACTN|nr:hypothetical protein Sgou_34250 [Streptomyces gougerotii]GGU42263.1 hypothetical protein GCM10015534_51190 [Streptomyces diastaticus subsp. diastaticus]
MKTPAPVAGRTPDGPAQTGIAALPGGGAPLRPGHLPVGVAVEFARTREAGVCGTGGGHHGVRKGSHGTFVGVVPNCLEVFGEKHTKG